MKSKNELRELFDYTDGRLFWRSSSRAGWNGRSAGTVMNNGYVRILINGRGLLAHRAIWAWHHGEWPEELDHINGKVCDNRIENLRPATHSQNTQNATTRKDNVSGFKGVTFHKATGKWMASIQSNKKRIYIGIFDGKGAAALAVANAREKHHQQFARHA